MPLLGKEGMDPGQAKTQPNQIMISYANIMHRGQSSMASQSQNESIAGSLSSIPLLTQKTLAGEN